MKIVIFLCTLLIAGYAFAGIYHLRLGLRVGQDDGVIATDVLLLESGDALLLESGDKLLLE